MRENCYDTASSEANWQTFWKDEKACYFDISFSPIERGGEAFIEPEHSSLAAILSYHGEEMKTLQAGEAVMLARRDEGRT